MGYNGKCIGNIRKGILIPILVEQRVRHEGPGFDDREEKAMEYKIMFVKENNVVNFYF